MYSDSKPETRIHGILPPLPQESTRPSRTGRSFDFEVHIGADAEERARSEARKYAGDLYFFLYDHPHIRFVVEPVDKPKPKGVTTKPQSVPSQWAIRIIDEDMRPDEEPPRGQVHQGAEGVWYEVFCFGERDAKARADAGVTRLTKSMSAFLRHHPHIKIAAVSVDAEGIRACGGIRKFRTSAHFWPRWEVQIIDYAIPLDKARAMRAFSGL